MPSSPSHSSAPQLCTLPQSLDLPVTTRKPATAPPPWPCSQLLRGPASMKACHFCPEPTPFSRLEGPGGTRNSVAHRPGADRLGPKITHPLLALGRARPHHSLSAGRARECVSRCQTLPLGGSVPCPLGGRGFRSWVLSSARGPTPVPTFQFHAGGKKTTSHTCHSSVNLEASKRAKTHSGHKVGSLDSGWTTSTPMFRLTAWPCQFQQGGLGTVLNTTVCQALC